MNISVGVSNRHIHLTKDLFVKLFGQQELTKKNDLKQPGEYASNEVLTIKTEKDRIDNVRILGPFRDYNQVEISKTDAYKLGINPPVRRSGDLIGAAPITIVGPLGQITLPQAAIIAERHIHMTTEYAGLNNFRDGQLVNVIVEGIKAGTMLVHIKVSDEAYFEMHLDTDDANCFMLKNNDEVELEK